MDYATCSFYRTADRGVEKALGVTREEGFGSAGRVGSTRSLPLPAACSTAPLSKQQVRPLSARSSKRTRHLPPEPRVKPGEVLGQQRAHE